MPSVLITGASRGIGLEHVRQFADRKWRVIACCRVPDRASELTAVAGSHSNVSIHKMDVSNFDEVEAIAKVLKDISLDILINNAGSYGPKGIPEGMAYQSFGNIDYGIWADILRTNLLGAMKVTECFVEQVARSERKTIVMMSSEIGSIADNAKAGQSYAYRSSKAALNMITKGLSLDLKARGITVVALAPGWVKTDMGGKAIATYTPAESVVAQQALIEKLSLTDSGRFVSTSNQTLPW